MLVPRADPVVVVPKYRLNLSGLFTPNWSDAPGSSPCWTAAVAWIPYSDQRGGAIVAACSSQQLHAPASSCWPQHFVMPTPGTCNHAWPAATGFVKHSVLCTWKILFQGHLWQPRGVFPRFRSYISEFSLGVASPQWCIVLPCTLYL
ncbi:hypothetical protein V5799_005058 [Amblyomma americanum]|uniref:Uncharacterized protein n=1 Tax=Amblyomma americanum TaxID=6943 RepID=A0AAQ4D4C2_AMBAM